MIGHRLKAGADRPSPVAEQVHLDDAAAEPPAAVATAEIPAMTAADITAAVKETLADSDLRAAFPDSRRLAERVCEHATEPAGSLNTELAALAAARKAHSDALARATKRQDGALLVCGVLGLACVGTALVGLYGLLHAWSGVNLGWDPTHYIMGTERNGQRSLTVASRDLLVGGLIIVLVLAWAWAWLDGLFARPVSALREAVGKPELELREALKVQVDSLARRLANTEDFICERAVVML